MPVEVVKGLFDKRNLPGWRMVYTFNLPNAPGSFNIRRENTAGGKLL
jgi:hypothetical protein